MPSFSSFFSNLKSHTLPLAVISGLLGAALFLYAFISTYQVANTQVHSDSSPDKQDVDVECCTVEVAGAVQLPGIYKITRGQSIQDALIAAGGFRLDADPEYVARELQLGQEILESRKVFIPVLSTTSAITAGNSSISSRVSVNTASLRELDTLPHIGEKTALKIIDARPFDSIEDFFERISFSVARQDDLRELIQL